MCNERCCCGGLCKPRVARVAAPYARSPLPCIRATAPGPCFLLASEGSDQLILVSLSVDIAQGAQPDS